MAQRKRQLSSRDHPSAVQARERVLQIIDSVDPADLVSAIKRAPSLRGMILGYLAEEQFEKYVLRRYAGVSQGDIKKHDDHNRSENKSDRTIIYKGYEIRIQLKSVQTNSIVWDNESNIIRATVQNDASDARSVRFPDGSSVVTTCYKRGDYDILAVPLFPFSGTWSFAYKTNEECAASASAKYTDYQKKYLLSTLERLTWPLSTGWCDDLEAAIGKLSRLRP